MVVPILRSEYLNAAKCEVATLGSTDNENKLA